MADLSEDQRNAVVQGGIRWGWAALEQIARLREDEAAIAGTVHDRPAEYTHETRIPFLRLRTDAHFCLLSAHHLVRALDALDAPPEHAVDLTGDLIDHVRVLRHCFEHWDERLVPRTARSGQAFREFAELFPDGDPNEYRFGAGGTYVGGLDLDRLEALVRRIYEWFLELESGRFVWKGWEFR